MRTVRVIAGRTLGRLLRQPSTAFAAAAFLSVTGIIFSFALDDAEGGLQPLSTLWAVSVAPVLPFLAAFLGMDVWSSERRDGRLSALLTVPVRESRFVFGKFLGIWVALLMSVSLSFAVLSATLRFFVPDVFHGVQWLGFVPASAALALQGALWCAVSAAVSAHFRQGALSACTAVVLTSLFPRALWGVLIAWAPGGPAPFGEMPIDAHAYDLASGLLPTGVLAVYAGLSALALYWNAVTVASWRFVGRAGRRARAGAGAVRTLAAVFTALTLALAFRLDAVIELPFGAARTGFSERTLGILAESQGGVTTTVFLSRADARFRSVSHLLRAFRRAAAAQGGCVVDIRTVDPRWDFAAAQRLVRDGVPTGSLLFTKGRRRVVLPLDDTFGERSLASALLRVTLPPQRSAVYWTRGHGESSFSDYGASGASDLARELSRDGYRHLPLDLSADAPIPSDCALILVAGPRADFGRTETARLDAYLRQGGRMLLLANLSPQGGLASMLSAWGLRAGDPPVGARTLSGTDTIASAFSTHPAVAPLAGVQIVLERPTGFLPSAAAAAGAGADSVTFTPLAHAGGACVAAALERGGGTGDDLALRPTRVIAVGDALFAMNGQLRAHGNANRDFLQNCIAYLAGSGALMAGGDAAGALVTGMDRPARLRFALVSSVFLPAAAGLLLFVLFYQRRRMS